MIFDSIDNLETYCDPTDPIYKALEFIANFDQTQPDGRYNIEDDEIYANVMTLTTAQAEEKDFEAHQNYLDVQVVLDGIERHDVVLLNNQEVDIIEDYNEEKDCLFFAEPDFFSSLMVEPGSFVVYGPMDGHRPGCCADEPMLIRKVCVKIKL